MDLQRLGEISLTDVGSQPHRLADLWAERAVVLVFLRHFG